MTMRSLTSDSGTRAPRLDRRAFLGIGAGALLGTGAIATAARSMLASQESATPGAEAGCATPGASPEASPVTGAVASPEASPAACPAGPVVHAVDLAFEPSELTIPAGTGVVVTIQNHGQLQHDFNIDELQVRTELLDAGDSTTVTINAAAGAYEFYCSVTGHKEAGMVGTLTVG